MNESLQYQIMQCQKAMRTGQRAVDAAGEAVVVPVSGEEPAGDEADVEPIPTQVLGP